MPVPTIRNRSSKFPAGSTAPSASGAWMRTWMAWPVGTLAFVAASVCHVTPALANGFEVPEIGTAEMGRAGAVTARADTPVAMALNPAGLAGQGTSILLDANFVSKSTCFQRAGNYPADNPQGASGFDNGYAGERFPQVCAAGGSGSVGTIPQLIFVYQASPRVSFAAGLVTPSAAGGKANWPLSVQTPDGLTAPNPARYLLLSQNLIIAMPTVGVGAEVLPGLRLGASFEWVIADLKFANVAQGFYQPPAESPINDLRADLTVKKWFTPAFVLGALYSPVPRFDVGAMFKWSGDITATGSDVTIQGPYPGNAKSVATTPATTDLKLANFSISQPWDLRLGFRYHQPRDGVQQVEAGRPRDPMTQDVFDLELDATYSHDSSLSTIDITFPTDPNSRYVAFGASNHASVVPISASVPHQWKDIYGVRFGGEWVVLPSHFALRAGVYYDASGVAPQNLGIDFSPTQELGLYGGATYRFGHRVDLSAGLGHVFFQTLNNTNTAGSVYPIVAQQTVPCSGTAANPASGAGGDYHLCNAANVGVLKQSVDMFSLGVTIHL